MSLLIDTTNIFRCGRAKFGPDSRLIYHDFIAAVEKMFGQQDSRIAYVARPSDAADGFVSILSSLGLETKTKEPREFEIEEGKRWKLVDWSVDITIDALALADPCEPTIICSSDYRLEPLINHLQNRAGIVVVWAIGVPKRYRCTRKEIALEHMKNADANVLTT